MDACAVLLSERFARSRWRGCFWRIDRPDDSDDEASDDDDDDDAEIADDRGAWSPRGGSRVTPAAWRRRHARLMDRVMKSKPHWLAVVADLPVREAAPIVARRVLSEFRHEIRDKVPEYASATADGLRAIVNDYFLRGSKRWKTPKHGFAPSGTAFVTLATPKDKVATRAAPNVGAFLPPRSR